MNKTETSYYHLENECYWAVKLFVICKPLCGQPGDFFHEKLALSVY